MDKSIRIVIIMVLVLVIINVFMLFDKSNLKEVQKNIEQSQRNIDSAIITLNLSKVRLDSIQSDLGKFKTSVINTQTDVKQMNTKKDQDDARDNATLKDLRKKLLALKEDVTKKTDTPPLIEIKSL